MLNEIVLGGFFLIILIYSVIIHEVAHGIAAFFQGDMTAKYAGRLNLNPLSHVDFFGSIVVPAIMYMTVGFVFGWAKPVPFNPYNLRNQKWGPALVAIAGPASNVILALFFAIIAGMVNLPVAIKLEIFKNAADFSEIGALIAGSFGAIIFEICVVAIFLNVLLAFFNMIPIPPLDGSKLLFAFLPIRIETIAMLEQFGFIFLLFFILFFQDWLGGLFNLALSAFMQIAI